MVEKTTGPVRRSYQVSICLRSPFLFPGTVNSQLGIDATYLRDEDGSPLLPGTQLRGVLRAALKATGLLDDGLITMLFGAKSPEAADTGIHDEPNRGAVLFDDLKAEKVEDSAQTTRIAIDEESGTVQKGALQVIEMSHPFGATCVFTGTCIIRYASDESIEIIENAFAKAIKLIPSIGAYKSAGFGEVLVGEETSFTVDDERALAVPQVTAQNPSRKRYSISFDRPFLIDAERVADNIFKSSTIIPGSVFKGAIAEVLKLAGNDPAKGGAFADALSQCRFSHAFPIGAGGSVADIALPRSVVESKGVFYNLMTDGSVPTAALIDGSVPTFVATGKAKLQEAARQALGLPESALPRIARTHVEINPDKLAAEDEQLFAVVMVDGRNAYWSTVLDTSAVKDGTKAAAIHQLFKQGLDGLGRTGATIQVEEWPETKAKAALEGDTVTFMLKTPTLMTDGAANQGKSPFDIYKDYFSTFLGGAELIRHFSGRKLFGGYAATRYRPYGAPWYPFVMTMPGSVFQLRLPTDNAKQAFDNAWLFGLPPAQLNCKDVTWKTCPYLPENGFGEITGVPAIKADKLAQPELVEAV